MQSIGVIKGVGGERGIEIEIRGAGDVGDAVGFAVLQTRLQVVGATLLRDLGAKGFALRPLIPIETTAAETCAADIQVRKVQRHAGTGREGREVAAGLGAQPPGRPRPQPSPDAGLARLLRLH